MATYTLTINENNPKGKSLINLLKSMDEVVTFEANVIVEQEASPYNKKFVKEIQQSRKSKGKSIKTEDLWK